MTRLGIHTHTQPDCDVDACGVHCRDSGADQPGRVPVLLRGVRGDVRPAVRHGQGRHQAHRTIANGCALGRHNGQPALLRLLVDVSFYLGVCLLHSLSVSLAFSLFLSFFSSILFLVCLSLWVCICKRGRLLFSIRSAPLCSTFHAHCFP